MPGIDKNRIVGHDSQQLDEFSCGICLDVLNRPMVTDCCRQMYCKDCIEVWLSRPNQPKICPNDRKALTAQQLREAPRVVINIIDGMKVKCESSLLGCQSIHTIGEDSDHK